MGISSACQAVCNLCVLLWVMDPWSVDRVCSNMHIVTVRIFVHAIMCLWLVAASSSLFRTGVSSPRLCDDNDC